MTTKVTNVTVPPRNESWKPQLRDLVPGDVFEKEEGIFMMMNGHKTCGLTMGSEAVVLTMVLQWYEERSYKHYPPGSAFTWQGSTRADRVYKEMEFVLS